ncbi:hypothetical protein [Megasphaera elsdenii]|uniref:hypothetical protein n=2 Tax=Megasphaera TaxID=906 RepID=UPI00265F749F|nr:hypothetical protein [Megasphaera elsdenii]
MVSKKAIRVMSTAMVLAMFAGMPLAQAKHHQLIHPGDHVIDMQRLQDSIKETAQKIAEYQQDLEKLKNKILLYSGVTGLNQRISAAIDRYSQNFHGRSFVFDPTAVLHDSILRTAATTEQITDPIEANGFQRGLLNEVTYANADALAQAQTTAALSGERLGTAASILDADNNGIVGTTQKSAALASLATLNENDETRMIAAETIRQIEADEREYAQERFEHDEAQFGMFYEYDPYHPSDNDREQAPKLENFGFLSTQDTGDE